MQFIGTHTHKHRLAGYVSASVCRSAVLPTDPLAAVLVCRTHLTCDYVEHAGRHARSARTRIRRVYV